MTYPLSKSQLLLGKFVGQGSIIALATLIGFGASAALLSYQQGTEEVVPAFAVFIGSAILLGLSFTALAYSISLLVNEKSKAAGMALILWFFFALVFDMGLLALLVGTEDLISQQGLTQLMMFNPADVFRLVNFAGLDNADINGAMAVAIQSSVSLGELFMLSALWVVVPLVSAIIIFRTRKI